MRVTISSKLRGSTHSTASAVSRWTRESERHGETERRRDGDTETQRHGDTETRRHGENRMPRKHGTRGKKKTTANANTNLNGAASSRHPVSASSLVAVIMGSQSDWETMRHAD